MLRHVTSHTHHRRKEHKHKHKTHASKHASYVSHRNTKHNLANIGTREHERSGPSEGITARPEWWQFIYARRNERGRVGVIDGKCVLGIKPTLVCDWKGEVVEVPEDTIKAS